MSNNQEYSGKGVSFPVAVKDEEEKRERRMGITHWLP